ncbi:MAG TPA: pantoate--beta-alanine ligase [Euzebya sp.]|nr:pantoate--beta-alanine ligase [Euzebya sp.]
MGGLPTVVRTVEGVRAAVGQHRAAGSTIGLVPTMGALHAGHLSLVQAAGRDNDVVVVSIFVNPLQFGPGEDLQAYPRTLQADLEALAAQDVQLVFHPDVADFTPPDMVTKVHVAGLTDGLEAGTRPTHFDGVTTIVTKLFNAVGPDRAYFGSKDFQQQAVIRRMVRDLGMPLEVVTCPLVREGDGLALSSRNAYLSAAQRQDALALSATLAEVLDAWDGDVDSARGLLQDRLGAAAGVRLDYAEVIDTVSLEPLTGVHTGPAQAVVAAWVGTTRLLDTVALPPAGAGR